MKRSVGRLTRPFGTLHYELTGSGPALVFAHGLGGNQMSWWQQVAHFAPSYTCIAFAHRGFAPSDAIAGGPDPADYAGDLAALIDHLGLPDVRLVGQSMGGWTVLEYAIAHPNKVKALVLSSTSGTIARRGADPSGGATYDAWLKDAETKIAAGLAKGVHPAVGMAAAERFPALHLLYKSIDEMAGALDKEKVRAGLRRTATRTLDALQDFRVPTLLVAGGQDVVFPAFLAKAIAARLPCAQAQAIPDAGHSPYFEQAATFNRLVEAFLSLHR
jgi:pimeloyl-ACP methyl ester carboxylesterase